MHTQRAEAIALNITTSDTTPDWALAGVRQAGDRWSSLLDDNITVNLEIRYGPLEDDVLASTDTVDQTVAYQDVYRALTQDISSKFDAIATQNLVPETSFDLLINSTSDSPFGYGSPTPYLDNDNSLNNQRIRLTSANAKALNLSPSDNRTANTDGVDAIITFNPAMSWDIDGTDGISSGSYDFVGIAAHEIGHALGFISGTDFLDENSPFSFNDQLFHFPEDTFTAVSPLDLFRFSETSANYDSGVIDWTANATDKYFSIDGGSTALASFSTGINRGDGESASHWKIGAGLMQPRIRPGQTLNFTTPDLIAFDVIGWNLSQTPNETTRAARISSLSVDHANTETLLAEPLSSFEMAIATAPQEPSIEVIPEPLVIEKTWLNIRTTHTAQPTEIPNHRSPVGIAVAIATLTLTKIYKQHRRLTQK